MTWRRAVMIMLGLALVLFGPNVPSWIRAYNGYCEKTGRYITEQEMFDAAIGRLLSRYRARCTKPGACPWIDQTTIEDFRRANPNCCTTAREPDTPPPGFTGHLLSIEGRNAGEVHIRHLEHQPGKDGNVITKRVDAIFTITNCGEARYPWWN
jgi:hypothetical protein